MSAANQATKKTLSSTLLSLLLFHCRTHTHITYSQIPPAALSILFIINIYVNIVNTLDVCMYVFIITTKEISTIQYNTPCTIQNNWISSCSCLYGEMKKVKKQKKKKKNNSV